MSENPQEEPQQPTPEQPTPEQPAAAPAAEPSAAPSAEPAEARTWAMLCHLGALAFYFSGVGHIVVPLIFWLLKKDQYALVDDQGKESLNFQISITIYAVVAAFLILTVILIPLVIVFWVALVIFDLVMIILAAIKANSGERYRYPLCIRFIK